MTLRESILRDSGILEEDTFQQRKERRIIDNERNRQKAILARNKRRAEAKATKKAEKDKLNEYGNKFLRMIAKFTEDGDSIYGSEYKKFEKEKIEPLIGDDSFKRHAYILAQDFYEQNKDWYDSGSSGDVDFTRNY